MKSNSIVCLLLLVILSSCNKKLLPTSSIEEKYSLETFEFDYLQAKSKVKFDNGDRRIGSSATIRIKKDSIIWFSFTPLFGIEAARGMITQDTIVVIDRVNKDVLRYNYKSLSDIINVDINFQMLQSALLGDQIFPYNETDEFKTKASTFEVQQIRERFLITTAANKEIRKISSVRVKEQPDGSVMDVNFSNFQTISGQAFPFDVKAKVEAKGSQKNTMVDINYSKVEIQDSPLSFPFSVPSSYE